MINQLVFDLINKKNAKKTQQEKAALKDYKVLRIIVR